MTLSGSGNARLAYRVTIDGCPRSAVTLVSMTSSPSAGVPTRTNGLDLQDAKFSVQADPLACKVTVAGLTVKLADVGLAWTGVFGKSPSNTTWLTADVNDTDTTITVSSTAGFASDGYIWIDSECIAYTSLGGGGVTFEGCTRGILSDDADAAQYHYVTNGDRRRSPEVTDWPVLWENRRVRVYRYDETQLKSGNGTQCFLGMIKTAPQKSGTAWSFSVDSIVGMLDQTLGADLDTAAYPRGIYYPSDYPLTMSIFQSTTSGADGSAGTPANIRLTGFFENQDDFIGRATTGLNALIAAAQTTAGHTQTVRAVSDGDAGWHLELYTTSVNHRYVTVDGPHSTVDSPMGAPSWGPQGVDGTPVPTTVSASTTYYYWPAPGTFTATSGIAPGPAAGRGIPGAGSVPRGSFNVRLSEEARTIYLGGSTPISSLVDAINIEWPPSGTETSTSADSFALSTYSTGDRSITLQNASFADGGSVAVSPGAAPLRRWTQQSLPSIRFGLLLSSTGGGSTYDFLNTITTYAPQFANLGVVPPLRSGDWDPVAWQANAVVGQPQLVTRNVYMTFSPIALGDVVRPGLQLAQCFLSVDSSGRMVPKPLRLPVRSELGDTETITTRTLLTDETLLHLETAGLGQVNEFVLSTGYDAREDKFKGRTIKVRDVAAYGQSPAARSIAIQPKSVYLGTPITDDDVVQCAAGIFGSFAGPYQIYTRDAAKQADAEVGDAAVFDDPHFPDEDGTLGVTGKVGLLLGVERAAYSPRTTLTILTTAQRIGGYAPAADVVSAVDNGGDEWVLTVDTSLFQSGTDASDWFATSDRVRVVEMNTLTGTVVVGSVLSGYDSPEIGVQFDGVWGGQASGTGLWYLTIADSDDASLAETQKRFTHIADAAGTIDYATDDLSAFRFNA